MLDSIKIRYLNIQAPNWVLGHIAIPCRDNLERHKIRGSQ